MALDGLEHRHGPPSNPRFAKAHVEQIADGRALDQPARCGSHAVSLGRLPRSSHASTVWFQVRSTIFLVRFTAMVVATAAMTFSPTGASPRASFSGMYTARPHGIRSRFTFCGSFGRRAPGGTTPRPSA